MNPYIALVAIAALIGAYFFGRHDGKEIEIAKQAKAEEIVKQSREAMQQAAAEAIAQITVKHQTIRAEVQREVVEKPVYRDCRADDSILHSLNAAKGIEPAGSGKLPGTSSVN